MTVVSNKMNIAERFKHKFSCKSKACTLINYYRVLLKLNIKREEIELQRTLFSLARL